MEPCHCHIRVRMRSGVLWQVVSAMLRGVIYSKSETFWRFWWGWSRLVASNSLTRLILSVKSGIIKSGEYPQGDKMTSRKLPVAGWCRFNGQPNLVWGVRHGAYLWSESVEPPMVRWESKTDRVNLCEVGGVSLPLMSMIKMLYNIAVISWRLIIRCYQHWKLSRDHITRYLDS